MQFPILKYPDTETKENKDQNVNEDSQGNTIDPKLLIVGPTVTYVHELFRSLRTKLNYRLEAVNGKSMLVTSYDWEKENL